MPTTEKNKYQISNDNNIIKGNEKADQLLISIYKYVSTVKTFRGTP